MTIRNIGMALLALVALWAAGLYWFVNLIPNEPANDTVNTDAIVVLTGGALRMEHGFELLAKGRAAKMFVSGVEDGVTLASLLHKQEYREFAALIPPGSVTLGYKARSTTGNAREIAEWVANEHVNTIRLVTGNYHMPRSIRDIHQTVPSLTIIPEPVFPKHFGNNEWWQSADSIRLVLSEYHKYVASLILG